MPSAQPDFLVEEEKRESRRPEPRSVFPEARREQFLERPLPSSEESEREIIGGILIYPDMIAQAAERLQPVDLYSPMLRRVYAAMLALFERSETIDPIFIGEELKKDGSVESIGGVAAITNITYGLPGVSEKGMERLIDLVLDKKRRRDLIRACSEIQSEALEEEEETAIVIDRAEQRIFDLVRVDPKREFKSIQELGHTSIIKAEEIMAGERKVVGLKTGLKALDNLTGGWQKDDLIIIAARPSMGKTGLLLQTSLEAVTEEETEDRVGAVFSLEMSEEQVIARLICSEGRANIQNYRQGQMLSKQFQDLVSDYRYNRKFKSRLFIDDTPAISTMEMRAKLRRLAGREKRLDYVAVDYLQLMSGSGRTENRVQEVSKISRDLKAIAKEFGVPVIALSQLSRAPEGRRPPKPMMSDLRESGSIEQDADVVVFIYREDYYDKTSENAGTAELIVAKQRNGPTDTVKAAFLKYYARFEDLAEERHYV
ncbi:MAG: replicative DNA helicase [Pyrinomonadaceae bacterium]